MKRFFPILLLLALLLCVLFAGCAEADPASGEPSPEPSHAESSTESAVESAMESSAESAVDSGAHVAAPPSEGAKENGKPDSALQNTAEDTMETMYILIGKHALTVKMADNSSAKALLALLGDGDMTVEAHDYGSFEKVGSLGTELPTNDEQIATEPGYVVLYQGNQIVIFYGTNSWSYSRLGKIEGVTADELKAILGGGDVTMVLSLNGPESSAPNAEF